MNEDEGAEMLGEPTRLGEEVVERTTGPDSPAPSFVQWKQLDSRQATLDGISKGEAYAAIVIPKDYSKTLASMSGPPPGATSGPPPGAVISDPVRGKVSEADVSTEVGLLPKAPKPAEIEILSNPSAGPSASAPVQNISTGIAQGCLRRLANVSRRPPGSRGRGSHRRSRR